MITASETTSAFLDACIEKLRLKNDAALARMLEIAPPVISKIRNGKLSIGSNLLLRLHEATGWNVMQMRKDAGLLPILSTTHS